MRDIGIGHIEPSEDRGFEPFHRLRLVIALVIVADEMQESMHREMREMVREGLALGVRFALRRLVGDHDIAEQARPVAQVGLPLIPGANRVRYSSGLGRERQHVGRRILAPPIAVERPDRQIIGQHDSNLALDCGRRRGRLGDCPAQHRFRVAPARQSGELTTMSTVGGRCRRRAGRRVRALCTASFVLPGRSRIAPTSAAQW